MDNINCENRLHSKLNFTDYILLSLILLFPIFFTILKSWSNGISFVLCILSLIQILKRPSYFLNNRSKYFWVITLSLLVPFISELFVQVVRGPFTVNALDGPSRFIIGALLFIIFSKYENMDKLFNFFSLGCMAGLLVSFIYVCIVTDYYYNGRCATSLLCPNALPVYIVILAVFSIYYVINYNSYKVYNKILIPIILFFSFYIIIICETRTVWFSVFFVTILIYRKNIFLGISRKKYISLIYLLIFSAFIFIFKDILVDRYVTTVKEYNDIKNGGLDSSLGGRLGLVLIDIHLANTFLFGCPDGHLPPLASLQNYIPSLSKYLYNVRITSGSHCELTAYISRKGYILGFLTIISLFILPLYVFSNKFIRNKKNDYRLLSYIITYMIICSFGVQVFGLKMTSTFWAVTIALLYGKVFSDKKI